MDTLLIIRNIEVENANSIAGFTWGFPAISNFLGFTHALSRKLPNNWDLVLEGCGVICHRTQTFAYKPSIRNDYRFALTRNPLKQDGKSPSFIEEGRMHMTISLIIPCKGELDSEVDREEAQNIIRDLGIIQRLAGGTIKSIGDVELLDVPEEFNEREKFEKKQLRKLLPGFALILRSDLLSKHTRKKLEENPHSEPLDAWLDFYTLKSEAILNENENHSVEWRSISKPESGWLVPIAVGYSAISELYAKNRVLRARDAETPFCFVELVYSVGEWISPHRIKSLDRMIWRYHTEEESGWYLCLSPETKKQ